MIRLAILGFGVEGRDAAKYFFKQDAEITVFDKKNKEELGIDTWTAQQGDPLHNIKWLLGEGYLDSGLYGFDLIVRSPGIRPDLPEILEAVSKGAQLSSNTKIFFDECKKPIIAVTGTKGKGTTASLIKAALDASGFKTILLGNIGEPMLSSLDEANKCDFAILELSSFQTIDLHKSPYIAVVTNITSDHMDWHTSQEEYEKAKEQLWANQTKNDYLVINKDDPTSTRLAINAPGNVQTYNGENEKSGELKIPGQHNVYNANAALLAVKLAGASEDKAWKGIAAFKGLEHRLEKVAEINGVLYVNDSYATNPEPALAAIRSYKQPKVLILGGSGKGADFTKMAEEISQANVRGVVLIGDEAEKIEKALDKAGFKGEIKKGFAKIAEIINAASAIANKGDVVILSPACASFGLFQNYKDRGKQFKEAVQMLK